MTGASKNSVTWQEVDEASADQRIDNHLLRELKGVPKSHVYRILRRGEVRVNSRRVDATYRLRTGDRIRIPPIRVAAPAKHEGKRQPAPAFRPIVLFEDDWLLGIDKPAGVAVHGGSGVSRGLIEMLRAASETPFLELVHRLDKETSGVLLLAKKRSALTRMHAALREGGVLKHYVVLVRGRWRDERRNVRLPLNKFVLPSGERRVSVTTGGQESHTVFTLGQRYPDYSLLEAELKTGRTHQIRVQLAHLGFPIAGDDKYGDFDLNRVLARQGLKRMFLHARLLSFVHPMTDKQVRITAPLPADLAAFLDWIEAAPIPGTESTHA